MKEEWGINTPLGAMMVNLDFFERIKVNKIKKSGMILFINIDYGDTISILEKNWNEIKILLRNKKINDILD
jgi:hypothetical protein